MNQQQKKSNGALIGSIIVILVPIILGIALIGGKKSDQLEQNSSAAGTYEEGNAPENLTPSDEITDIEADLNSNADFEYIDSGLE